MHASRPVRVMVALLAVATVAAHAQGLHDTRTWTGKNGRTLEAKFASRDGTALVLTTGDGKTLRVEQANLSEADARWLEKAEKAAAASPPPAVTEDPQAAATGKPESYKKDKTPPPLEVPAPEGYAPVVVADAERPKIPRLNHRTFDKEPQASVSSSFIAILLFWKDQGVVGTTAGQTEAERNEWIKEAHIDLIRSMRVRKTAKADFTDLGETFTRFVRKETGKDDFTCVVKIETDLRPETLSRWTHGAYGTILRVSHTIDGKPAEGFALPVATINKYGKFSINAWGNALSGELTPAASGDGGYEIKLREGGRTPKWFTEEKHALRLDPKNGDGLIVIAPFLRSGKAEKK